MKTGETTLSGLLLATIAAFGLAACSAPASESAPTVALHPDHPAYDTVDALAAKSDLIVEVTVGKSVDDVLLPEYEGDDPAGNPHAGTTDKPDPQEDAIPITVFDATVKAVYHGDVPEGETIQIKQLGGTSGGTRYTVEGVAPLVEGDTILVFLSTYPDSPASILGGDAGAFTLQGDTFVSIGDDELTATPAELSAL